MGVFSLFMNYKGHYYLYGKSPSRPSCSFLCFDFFPWFSYMHFSVFLLVHLCCVYRSYDLCHVPSNVFVFLSYALKYIHVIVYSALHFCSLSFTFQWLWMCKRLVRRDVCTGYIYSNTAINIIFIKLYNTSMTNAFTRSIFITVLILCHTFPYNFYIIYIKS